ncbi:MAG: GNAT family N-acetyltransferase, partial [Aggregatilineales bacterium]
PLQPALDKQTDHDITIRRGMPPEKHFVLSWIREHFSEFWVSEADVCFAQQPPSIFLAIADERVIGFACYDSTRRGFFGPTGVGEAARGKGTGTALLLACLWDMWHQGYGYAIIGAAGPTDYYQRVCGATIIEESTYGVYEGMLRK